MKRCTLCGQIKSFESFYNSQRNKDGKKPNCKECDKVHYQASRYFYHRKYREQHREHLKEAAAIRQRENKEKVNAMHRECYRKNPIIYKISKNAWRREREKDPQFRMLARFRTSIYKSIKQIKNGRPWEFLVGYTLADLHTHLETQFTEGMTWANYGSWHIDHRIPISWWQFDTPNHPEFKQCWALCNLRPLWAKENLSKGRWRAA